LPDTPASPTSRRSAVLEHLAFALVAAVPQLLSRPGTAVADTKSNLYLDPGRFLRQSVSIWDPRVGLGTVTHQQIGYLFPMGPFFWVTRELGVPTWAAQRLWTAALLFAASSGVLFLCRTLRIAAPGSTVAAAAYMLSPYFLQYVGRISVILLPWAALGWLVGLTERALRAGRWRHPALIALFVAGMSGVNASGALYVGIAPVLWLAYAGVSRLHPWRAVWTTAGRTALLVAATSAWWVAGLVVEGAFGIDVLRYTETVPVTSSTSSSSEVLRGLGYWYFYGGDALGPWVPTLTQFTQQLWLLLAGYGSTLLATAGAFAIRWRHRSYFVILLVVGMVLAVGAFPFDSPSPAGRVLKGLVTHTQIGLAMRSTDRATPLVLLAVAVLAGATVAALVARARWAGLLVAGAGLAVVLVADPAVWNGTTVPTHFAEPGTSPAYVQQAAAALDAVHPGTTVLAVPGENFAAYRYGDTVDPVWPAVLDRPFVTREQQVMGSLAGLDLLYGFDDPMQNGVTDPRTFAPLARLLGAGDVLVQNDLAYERYEQPDPAVYWSELSLTPPGLRPPLFYGAPRPNISTLKALDEQVLALAPAAAPPPVAVFAVAGPRPAVRAEPVAGAVVVDGDGPGLVTAAGLGLLEHDPPVLYAGTLDTHPDARRATLAGGPQLVVTDTNRRQAFRWNTVKEVAGRTLGAGEPQPADPNNSPLDIFPGAPADAQTTAALSGVQRVTASSYGNSVAYLPEVRPVEAIDGNLDTAWEVGPFSDLRGQWWQVTLTAPRTTDHVTLVQPYAGDETQWITRVTLRFDGGRPFRAVLDPDSRTAGGQTLSFGVRRFRTLRITIDATNLSPAQAEAPGASPVGLAEVRIAGVQATEHVVMPRDLLRAAGPASVRDRLTLIVARQRLAPVPPRRDPEAAVDRVFWLPTARTFTLTGTARIDPLVPDGTIDQLVGRPGSSGSGVVAYSIGRLPGDRRDTASAALDGDPSTMWSPGFGATHQAGDWLSVHLPQPVRVDHLDLRVVADGRHSVPRALRVDSEHGSATLSLPAVSDSGVPDATVTVPVRFPALTGQQITVTVLAARLEYTHNYYSGGRIALPLGIDELGIPGVHVAPPPAAIPAPCRSDLLSVDGRPVQLRVSGSSDDALAGRGLAVHLCGSDSGGLRLGPGTHQLVAALGHGSGLDLDQLVLDSAPGGGPQAGDTATGLVASTPPAAPTITVQSAGPTTWHLHLRGAAGSPFWLVLGQSLDDGWHTDVDGGPSLGPAQLVDGFANGWLVHPGDVGGRAGAAISVRFTPQEGIDAALVVSLTAASACLVLALWPARRRRPPRHGRSGRHRRGRAALAGTPVAGTGRSTADLGRSALVPTEVPVLASPLAAAGTRPPWLAVVTAVLGAGALAASVAAPWWGVVMAAAVAGVGLARRARAVVAAGACALVVATAVVLVVGQWRHHYPANGNWPSHFHLAHTLAWGAVVLLASDVVVELVRRRAARWGDGGSSLTGRVGSRRPSAGAGDARRAGPGASRRPWPPT
jgi:hypothetical protein